MTIFWILAAGLAFLAVLFAVAPLLQPSGPSEDNSTDSTESEAEQARINLGLFKQQLAELDADLAAGKLDQTVYESARRDLERELLNDLGDRDPLTSGSSASKAAGNVRLPGPRATAMALILIIPFGAWALYAMIGSQSLIPQLEQRAASARSTTQPGGSEMPPLSELVARMEERLEQQPDDAEGWTMLGRTYFAIGNRAQAEEALARAYALEPSDTMIVLTYAEAIASNNDSQLEGKPAELISEALELEPENTTARWLAAMVAFQRGQFRSAATSWKRLLDGMDPASEEATELRSMIEEAERRAGTPPQARQLADATTGSGTASAPIDNDPPTIVSPEQPQPQPNAEPTAESAEPTPAPGPGAQAAPTPAGDASDAPGLSVNVRLAPGLEGRYPPSTTLFVFARAASGPPMPLAVQRFTVGDLPVQVRLDDSMAMMPAMRLSAFPQVIVGARVSPSAQAMPRPGDLEGETGPVASSTQDPVSVLIDRVRP